MRAVGVVAAVTFLLLAPSRADAGSCAAKGSATLAENSVARIYLDMSDDTIACSKVNGNRLLLLQDSYDYAEELKLRGHFVAHDQHTCDESGFGCFVVLLVHDVRRDDEVFLRRASPETFVLRSNGSVAWTEAGYPDIDGPGGFVFRHTRRGTTRLDAGPRVDVDSLRLTGRKLSWINDGERRRATLR